MSKIIVAGSSIVLKSDATLEDIKKLAKYRPAALELRDEKDKLIYKVAVGGGNGEVTEKALYFSPKTHDADGLATITLQIPDAVCNVKEYAADLLGGSYVHLVALEEQIAAAVTEVDTFKAEMMERITLQ